MNDPQRAILRGRTEVRNAMHRDRPTIDSSAPTPETLLASLPELQIPIESDADAGFALRTRKARVAKPVVSSVISNHPLSSPARRRKPFPRREVPNDSSSPPSTPTTPPLKTTQSRPYSISDTLRHVRASSLSALGGQFRSSPTVDRSGKRSQRSLNRWFGNTSDSSEDEQEGLSPALPGPEDGGEVDPGTARFTLAGSAIVDEPSSSEEAETSREVGQDDA